MYGCCWLCGAWPPVAQICTLIKVEAGQHEMASASFHSCPQMETDFFFSFFPSSSFSRPLICQVLDRSSVLAHWTRWVHSTHLAHHMIVENSLPGLSKLFRSFSPQVRKFSPKVENFHCGTYLFKSYGSFSVPSSDHSAQKVCARKLIQA